MKITCQSCQSKYTVSDEKVQGKTVKIKCRKCGATILVNSSGVTTSGAGTAESVSTDGSPSAGSYLVNVGEGDQRSMTVAEIVSAYQTSVVTSDTYIWADGMADWQPISQVDAIVTALTALNANAPAPAASAPQAAKREPDRRADIFEPKPSQPSSNGKSAPVAAASAPREENSTLFSLSALTAKTAAASAASAAAAPVKRETREDSGLIDLKALAASASAAPAPASNAGSILGDDMGMGMFPLGAPPVAAPVVAPPVVAPSMPPPKSKAPIFIGVGSVVALAAIVGAFLLARGGGDKQAQATANSAVEPPPTAPTVTAPPSATEVASAAPPASASAASSVAVAKVPGKNPGKAPSGPGPKAGPSPAPGPGPAPAPAAKPKGNCGCTAGDLMCAMRCSAGK